MKKFYSLLLVMVLVVSSAIAGPITSTAAGGTWSSGTTWVGGVAPGAGDDVYIVPGATVTVTANTTINSITFPGTATTARTLTVSTGVVLTITTSITLENAIANNTAATIAGAGTIDCASLKVGGTVTTGFTNDRTIGLTSTITVLNVSGNLTVRSEDETSNQATSTFTHTSGTITVGGSVVVDAENDGAGSGSATATFTMNGGGAETGTLVLSGATPFSTPGTGTATFDATGGSATVNYSGDVQTVRATTYRNLTLSGSGDKTLTSVTTISTNLRVSGSASATTSSAMTVANDVILSNTASLTTGNTLSISGDLTIPSGTSLTVGGFNFSVAGTTTIDGTLSSNSTAGTKTLDNIIINTTGVFNSTADEDYSLTGSLAVNGSGSLTSGAGTWTFSGNSTINGTGSATITTAVFTTDYSNAGKYTFTSLTVSGATSDFTNNGTVTVTSVLAGTGEFIQGAGDFFNFGGASIDITAFTATGADNRVNYNGTVQTIRGVAYQNLTLSVSDAKTLGAATTVNDTLSMRGTASLALGAFALTYSATASLEYAGSTAQTTTDIEFKSTGGPRNLKINNSNGVTLHAARSVAGTVIFTNGIFSTTAANLLTIVSGGTVSGASDASFTDGPVKKTGTASFDFPVGKTGVGYMKIGIAGMTGGTTEFTAEYFRASAATTFGTAGLASLGMQAISNCEYWTLVRAVTTSAANVTLYWNSHSPCGGGSYLVDPLFGIRVVHFNTSLPTPAWDAYGGGTPSGDAAAGSVTWTGVTNFSPFALGALIGSESGLPVMFSNVKAFEKNRGVQIDWSNLTERDLIEYIVERSANGVNFTAINQQQPRSNNNDKESYSAFDAAPFSGANFYRVKVLEISGKIIYSKVIRVDIGRTMQGFTLYPNPVKGNQVSVGISTKQGQYTIKVLNTAGQEIYSQRIVHQGGSLTQVVELPSAIKPGVYNMLISGDNYREAKMFVVQ